MKGIIGWVSILISGVNAVKYFGITPSISGYTTIENYVANFKDDNYEIVSILGNHNHDEKVISDYLATANMYNMTLREALPQAKGHAALVKRDTQVTCTTAKVTDTLGEEKVGNICNALATVAGGTYGAVSMVIYSKNCHDATNGALTFCNILIGFFGGGGGILTANTVVMYCPNLLNQFDTQCKNEGGTVQDTVSKNEMTESISQVDRNCDQVSGPCTTFSDV